MYVAMYVKIRDKRHAYMEAAAAHATGTHCQ